MRAMFHVKHTVMTFHVKRSYAMARSLKLR